MNPALRSHLRRGACRNVPTWDISATQGRELILNHAERRSRAAADGVPARRHPDADARSGVEAGEGRAREPADGASEPRRSTEDALLQLLAHPNIASKHRIIRQYDHEVQGNTVVRPLGGPGMVAGPDGRRRDRARAGFGRGLAIANGLATNGTQKPEAIRT
jgi:hypothetical protein